MDREHYDRILQFRTMARKLAFVPGTGEPQMDPAMQAAMGAAGGEAPAMDPAMMQAAMGGGGAPPPMDPAMMGGAPAMDPAMLQAAMGGGGAGQFDPAMLDAAIQAANQIAGQQAGGAEGGADPITALNDKIDALGYMLTKVVEYLGVPLEGEASQEQPMDQEGTMGQEQVMDELVPDEGQQQELAAVDQEQQQAEDPNSALSDPAQKAVAPQNQSSFIRDQLSKFRG